MRFTYGEVIVCTGAPWHDHSERCGIVDFGPKKHEPVTVDEFIEEEATGLIYIRLKEYPNDPEQPENKAIFREDFFDHLNSNMSLTTILKTPTHDPKTA